MELREFNALQEALREVEILVAKWAWHRIRPKIPWTESGRYENGEEAAGVFWDFQKDVRAVSADAPLWAFHTSNGPGRRPISELEFELALAFLEGGEEKIVCVLSERFPL